MLKTGIIPDGATRWARYRIGYHLVWVPKYRRAVLRDDVVKTLWGALSRACDVAGHALLAAEADRDHVHVLVSAPPPSPRPISRGSSRGLRPARFARPIRTSPATPGRAGSGPRAITRAPSGTCPR